jgi:hypothetical protein
MAKDTKGSSAPSGPINQHKRMAMGMPINQDPEKGKKTPK